MKSYLEFYNDTISEYRLNRPNSGLPSDRVISIMYDDYLKKEGKTNILPQQVRDMEDSGLLAHLSKYPYWSMWANEESKRIAEYRLCLIQGNRYLATGNINAFKNNH